jgi:hypothetical protein
MTEQQLLRKTRATVGGAINKINSAVSEQSDKMVKLHKAHGAAMGEEFDKLAKLLGMPPIEKLASEDDEQRVGKALDKAIQASLGPLSVDLTDTEPVRSVEEAFGDVRPVFLRGVDNVHVRPVTKVQDGSPQDHHSAPKPVTSDDVAAARRGDPAAIQKCMQGDNQPHDSPYFKFAKK